MEGKDTNGLIQKKMISKDLVPNRQDKAEKEDVPFAILVSTNKLPFEKCDFIRQLRSLV